MRINDLYLHLRKFGNEGKEIIFLHGWGQECSTFLPVIEHLDAPYQIYLLDFPGFGKSDEPKVPYHLDDYVEVLEKVIKSYKIKEPLVIGHSFGGRVAIKHASQYTSVGKMILVNSAGIKERRCLNYYYKIYKYKILKRIMSLKPFRKYKDNFLKNQGSKDYQNASEMMKKTLINIVNEDLTEELKKIYIPVLLFWGKNDRVTPIDSAYKMKELLLDSGLVNVPNGGHFSYLDDPYLLSRVIQSFHQ